jgi:PBP1b-binding outer membrane lipoprotein LpoB/peroxiredoxin
MKTNFSFNIIFALFSCVFLSCSDNNHFVISGTVESGAGKTVYFEHITSSSVELLDSVELKNDGAFHFSGNMPDAPDFYRLRLSGQIINLSVDSTEKIIVRADTASFARNYKVEGSVESEKIKALTFLQLAVNEKYTKLNREYQSKNIPLDSFLSGVNLAAEAYKAEAKKTVLENPSSASAYFAVFQTINNMLIFDPYNRADSKIFGAVANLWNIKYPKALRTKHLTQLFTNSLKIIREQEGNYEKAETDSRQYFDISLPSIDDTNIRLSEIGNGRVVLLDFTAYELQESPAHNYLLSQLYKEYYRYGFDIYQVSLDSDRHFWKNAASNLPWHCVIDPQSVYSEVAKRYNVSAIPQSFLIDRTGLLSVRIEDLNLAKKEIKRLIDK